MVRRRVGPWLFDDDPPAFGERLTIARLEWCLDVMRLFRCPPPVNSRFPAGLRYLQEIEESPDLLEDPDVRSRVAEIQRSAWELMVILRAAHMCDRHESPFTAEKLRDIQRGKVETDSSHARNTQFEQYVPALLVNAGFRLTRGDPDARMFYFNEQIGIEAKRVSSLNPNTLRGHLSHAARQISGPPGDGPIQVPVFEEKLAILDREARVLRDKEGVIGLVAFGHVARWRLVSEPRYWRLDTLYPMRWVTLTSNDATDIAIGRQFTEYLGRIETFVRDFRTKIPGRPRPR